MGIVLEDQAVDRIEMLLVDDAALTLSQVRAIILMNKARIARLISPLRSPGPVSPRFAREFCVRLLLWHQLWLLWRVT